MLTPKVRKARRLQWAIWIDAKEWATGAAASMGLWTGGYSAAFTAGGVLRQFQGVATLIGLENISYDAGASVVQTQSFEFGGVSPAVEMALRGYNAKRAKIQVFQIYQDAITEQLLTVERVFKGEIDTLEIGDDGMQMPSGIAVSSARVSCVSTARNGTKILTLKKSDGSQRLVSATDTGRQYSDVSGSVEVTWMGETQNPHRPPGGNEAWDETRGIPKIPW